MSHQASSWALDQECETATEKAVLMIVASYAGPDGTCFPGQDTIAKQACCSVKSVERALRVFEERGWITREARRRADGSRTSDLISLVTAPNPEAKEQPDTESVRAEPTRHPVQTNPTPCPILTDTMSGPTTLEPVRGTGKTEQARPTDPLAEQIWQIASPASRNRSSRKTLRQAVAAAVRAGATDDALRTSVERHCRASGDHAKGVHRIIEAELWRDHAPRPIKPIDPGYQAAMIEHFRKTGEWRGDPADRPKAA